VVKLSLEFKCELKVQSQDQLSILKLIRKSNGDSSMDISKGILENVGKAQSFSFMTLISLKFDTPLEEEPTPKLSFQIFGILWYM
jgi:hypothetical protein